MTLTGSSTQGIKPVLHPVSDLATAKGAGAIGVGDRGHQAAATNVVRGLLHGGNVLGLLQDR